MDLLKTLKLDKTAFSIRRITDPSDDKAYWLSRSPEERMRAMMIYCQLNYGPDFSTQRMQRVLEVVNVKFK
jgi:hypothetical protein